MVRTGAGYDRKQASSCQSLSKSMHDAGNDWDYLRKLRCGSENKKAEGHEIVADVKNGNERSPGVRSPAQRPPSRRLRKSGRQHEGRCQRERPFPVVCNGPQGPLCARSGCCAAIATANTGPIADRPLLDPTAQRSDIPLMALAVVGGRTTKETIEPGAVTGPRSSLVRCQKDALLSYKQKPDRRPMLGGWEARMRAEPLAVSKPSRTNADDGLPGASHGRVEGRDGVIESREVADVCP